MTAGCERCSPVFAALCRDTSGQGRFCTIFRSYSRGAQVRNRQLKQTSPKPAAQMKRVWCERHKPRLIMMCGCVSPQGILLVYDITNRWSFDGIDRWIREIDEVRLSRSGTRCSLGAAQELAWLFTVTFIVKQQFYILNLLKGHFTVIWSHNVSAGSTCSLPAAFQKQKKEHMFSAVLKGNRNEQESAWLASSLACSSSTRFFAAASYFMSCECQNSRTRSGETAQSRGSRPACASAGFVSFLLTWRQKGCPSSVRACILVCAGIFGLWNFCSSLAFSCSTSTDVTRLDAFKDRNSVEVEDNHCVEAKTGEDSTPSLRM